MQVFKCVCVCCDATEEPGCNGPAQFVCIATQRPSRSTDSIREDVVSLLTLHKQFWLWVTVELGMNGRACTHGRAAGDVSVSARVPFSVCLHSSLHVRHAGKIDSVCTKACVPVLVPSSVHIQHTVSTPHVHMVLSVSFLCVCVRMQNSWPTALTGEPH